jgi:hypothetical protein
VTISSSEVAPLDELDSEEMELLVLNPPGESTPSAREADVGIGGLLTDRGDRVERGEKSNTDCVAMVFL